MGTLPIWLGALLALGVFAAAAALSYTLSDRLLPTATTRVRLCAAGIVFLWGQGLAFYALIFTRQFAMGQVVALGIAAAVATTWVVRQDDGFSERLQGDIESVRSFIGFAFGSWALPVTLGAGSFLGAHLLRSLVIPPLAWDSLLYHLVRPALWIQESGIFEYNAGGKSTHWRLFPPLGNSLSGWNMVLVESDVLLPLVWFGVWSLLVLGAYTIGRQLGASRFNAYLASLTAALIPAISSHIFVSYSDHVVAVLVVFSLAMLIHMARASSQAAGVLAVAALAVGVAVKQTVVPFAGMGGLAFLYLAWSDDQIPLVRICLQAGALSVLIIAPHYAYVWAETGSPVYPYGLEIGDWVIFEGRSEEHFQGTISDDRLKREFKTNLWQQFIPGYPAPGAESWRNHVNLGPALPLLLLSVGLVPLANALRERSLRVVAGCYVFAAMAALILVIKFSNGSGWNVARYAAAAPIVLLALAAVRKGWIYKVLFAAAFAVHLFYFWPTNWGGPDTQATVEFGWAALAFLAVAAVVVAVAYFRGSTWTFGAALGAAALLAYLAPATVLEPIRADYRYDIYRSAADGESFANVPVTGSAAGGVPSAPTWEAADDPDEPRTIAVVAGWDGRGANVFVYPYFGRRLQNEIVYVPPASDGQLIQPNQKVKIRRSADYDAWLDRLYDHGVDYVGVLGPLPMEAGWMRAHPESFELVTEGLNDENLLFELLPREGTQQRLEQREKTLSEFVLDKKPASAHARNARFSRYAKLVGYDISATSVEPGDEVEISYVFEALRPMPKGYRLLVHAEGSGPYTNFDHVPVDGLYPVGMWQKGEFIVDTHTIEVPRKWRRGKFNIYVGFWKPGRGRLKIYGGDKKDANRALVTTLEVR